MTTPGITQPPARRAGGRVPLAFPSSLAAALLLALFVACVGPDSETPADTASTDPGTPGEIRPEIWPELESPVGLDPAIESRVDEILGAMTLEEKVGQVIQAEIRHVTPDDVREYNLGSVLNGGGSHPGGDSMASVDDWIALADAFWEASTDTSDGGRGVPLLWGTDAVHGHGNVVGATIFPHNIGLGATRDADLVRRVAEVTAREVAVTGIDWNFGPTLAVPRDDRWGRTYEGYSEDPALVAELGGAYVEGLQGRVGSDEFLGEGRVIATAKHFLGDGGTHGGKDQGDNRADELELRDIHGAGYVTALEAGAQTVMASFSSWHGDKMHAHEALLTDVLKERMGFDGFVVGDWNGHGQVPGCSNASCAPALLAGIDLFMVPEDWKGLYENTLEQVSSGVVPAERLDDAVRRILRVKLRSGLFDAGAPSSRPLAGREDLFGSPEHRAVAREAVRKSLVLLKNAGPGEGGLLPLARDQRVLVTGPGADSVSQQSGGWTITWQGTGTTPEHYPGATSIAEGVRALVEGAGGSVEVTADGSFTAEPEVALVVYGETPYAEFQGDAENVDYPQEDGLEMLRALREKGIATVSVFLTGRPLWANPEINASDAFVVAWLPGSEGDGVADVLFRAEDGSIAHDFTGTLPFSWPTDPSQTTVNVGDAEYDPLWKVGHGLTYADAGDLEPLSEEIAESGEAESRTVYFDGGPVPPWKLFVGNADGAVPAQSALATTRGGPGGLELRVADRRVQEDARSVQWAGDASARAYLRAEDPIDLERESNGGLALAFDVAVDTAPEGSVSLGFGGGDEIATLDLTSTLSDLEPETWSTVRVRLRCFAEAGADLSTVDTPFLLETDGALALRFSDVRLVTAADGEAPCP